MKENHKGNQGQEQSLVEHLSDLRSCLIRSIIGILIGFGVCWTFSSEIFSFIRGPITPFLKEGGLVFTHPMDKFMAHVKVSLLAGIITTCPYWVYQIWRFISPGLYAKEKKYGLSFIFFGTTLFLSGVSFVYFIVFPMAFQFLLLFGDSTDIAMITIKDYLSFFSTVTLVFGAAFEMPLILTILGMMGVIDHHFLRTRRRLAIVALAAMSAIITPPDVISMLAMMVPLIFLYELSIWDGENFGSRKCELVSMLFG